MKNANTEDPTPKKTMNNILILFGHPAFKRSTINTALREAVEALDGITFHDLYSCYPDFLIDVPHEQQLCESHDKDREIDMVELDKAWTAANPET